MSENRKKLRTGFTTGTAAAAAVKGALLLIQEGIPSSHVRVRLLTGDTLLIPLHKCRLEAEGKAVCSVIKDAGDDPDITHKAEIGAIVTLPADRHVKAETVLISGGKGVGKITKPGLEIPPGESAINPGPRKMIMQAVNEVLGSKIEDCPLKIEAEAETRQSYKSDIRVEIFVPRGEALARKTLNQRLGIVGGISVLGTTGLVKPMSHEAYMATIISSLSVACAAGLDQVVLTTGRRSERYARHLWKHLPEESFIQIGDFFKASLDAASEKGFKTLTLAVFFGKAVKMAQGVPHTHAAKSDLTMHRLSDWTFSMTNNRYLTKKILGANTARHAFDLLADYPEVIAYVGRRMLMSAGLFAGMGANVSGIIFDYNGEVIFQS
ncbi:MAG: cobalamin biosynthesis protein CbiD [Desulfobacteraceae bacterium 4572_88]|nr:MAG: cobalamin biosynthesis protein CbiD [Desulfobacteraceae bacterium 4572_88]